MKKGRNHLKYFGLLLLIISINLLKINCDNDCTTCDVNDNCNGDNCDNCKYYENNTEKKCILCQDLTADSYYSFISSNELVTCNVINDVNVNDISSKKLIYGTKELVDNCPESYNYNLGSICYSDKPINSKLKENNENNEYECLYSYTKEIKDKLEYINCLAEREKCPSNFNYITTINNTISQCSKECFPIDNVQAKIYKDNVGNMVYYYCLKDCPLSRKYYYETGDNAYNCIIKCDFDDNGDFSKGEKCIINNNEAICNGYIKVDSSKNIFDCIGDSFNSCPIDYPYQYDKEGKKYCLKSCQYTQSISFFNKITYIYETSNTESTIYKCLEDVPDQTETPTIKYYKDNSALKIVTDCTKSNSGPYHNDSDNTCYNSCDNYSKDLECVSQCNPEDSTENIFYIDEQTKKCYSKCPSNLQRGFYNNEKKCISCNKTEGFYKSNDQKCYEACDTSDYYYNYDNNFCFNKECKDYSNYKYHLVDKNICYKSCLDINLDTIKYEKNYICYINDPYNSGDDYKYKYNTSSGIIKYITENDLLTECYEANLKYLKNNECVNNCLNDDYKIIPIQNKIGECIQSDQKTEANCKFYNKTMICSDECKFLTILDDSGNLKDEDNENCVEQCPTTYYKNTNDKTCTTSCKNELYTNITSKECVSKCEAGFFEVDSTNNIKKCVEKCKKTNENNEEVYSHYLETGQCQETCSGDYPYSYDTTNDHQLCLRECPKEKPYHKNNICVDKCDYYVNGDCVDNCNNYQYIHQGNICSNDPCPQTSPFFYSETSSSIKICNITCPENYYKNFKNSESTSNNIECLPQCEGGGVIYNNGCYNKCPDGLYNLNGNCVSNCPNKFYRDNNENKCITNCNEISDYSFYRASGECVQNCPIGENFLNDNECSSKCQNNYFYYEYLSLTDYKIYKCVENCDDESSEKKKYINGTKECISGCGELYEYNNICYENCLSVDGYSYSLKEIIGETTTYKCSPNCNGKFYGNNKICIDSCNDLPFNKTANPDNFCVRECDLNSTYKYLNNISNSLSCKNQCENNQRYLASNFICIDKCPQPYNYIVKNGDNPVECLSSCPQSKPFARYDNDKEEYLCSSDECGSIAGESNTYYYLNKKICEQNCNEDYEITDTKICSTSCDYYDSKKLYSFIKDSTKKCVFDCKDTDYKYTSIDGKCVENCEPTDFYDENDLICKIKCPSEKKIDGQICRESCYNEELDIKKYEDENGYCVDSCNISNTGFIYNKEDEYKCLNNCSNLYIDDNICKTSCGNKYIYENICLPKCPNIKRFFKQDDRICLTDCPENYAFYIYEEELDIYKCTDNCLAYIASTNVNMNAKRCLNNCKDDYSYFIYENENEINSRKICYAFCPPNYPFYKDDKTPDSQNLECYKECPDNFVHLKGSYKCFSIEECNTGIIKYESKECIEQCSRDDKIYEVIISDKLITYCIDNCTIAERYLTSPMTSLKLTYDFKCVKDCPGYSIEENKECICSRLFYYNKTTGFKNCLNPDLTLCETIIDYPIIKINENECIDYCDGILSLSGYECYDNNYKCEINETLITLNNGNKKCDCIDKYYYIIENERTIKKCLNKNDNCPSNFPLFIKETKECVKECPPEIYNKQYGKLCVSNCPSSTKENNNKCECEEKWYISDNYDVICLKGECPNDKNIYVEETKQCVSSCIGTGFEVYFNKTCIDDCTATNTEKVNSNIDPIIKHISKEYCKCKNTWYYDTNGYEICKNEDISCNSIDGLNFKYMITSTKQCINSCPEDYPYMFNDKCLLDCGNEHYKDKNLCKCKNLWKYDDDEKTIICLNINDCPDDYLLINNKNQCYYGNNCPKESPLKFNNICYEINKCPTNLNTEYDKINLKCACIDKWYYTDSGDVNCLSKNRDCPSDYPYLIYDTKECKKNKEGLSSLYEFNYVLYNNCPEKTKQKDNSYECICDPLYGYWYHNISSDGRDIIVCGEEECPTLKKFSEHLKKECISICSNNYPYLYQGICYEKCPELTEVIGNNNECQLKTIDTEITLENLEKRMTENIVDLYRKSNIYNLNNSTIGQKIVTQNATVEFYGVNKQKRGNNNNIQSDLSYIDISECIEKIYKSNGIEDKEDIIILKFDMNKLPNNYLINPVEYKLINSATGGELDASVCEHNSIRISYPLHDIISKYDKMTKKLRQLEYIKITLTSDNKESLREKLDKGKEIIENYPNTDIFDINDKIYFDICIAVTINGKDLTIQDRINYFYPQLSLCENNCTYNHTDFTNERIYCDCSYKTEFDFKREYSSSFELNLNELDNNHKSNSNIVIMKCVSNLKNSKSLSNNGGFIYSLIITVIEIILFFIIAFYGIYSLAQKLKNKMKKNEEDVDYENNKNNVINTDEKKNYDDYKTSERNLDNPPKKKIENFEMEFIPQEYLFLFFNQGEKGVIKKVEKDSVPFKTKYNTRILLEQKKGVNYDNINPKGPFPPEQNLLVIVDSMEDDINDYLQSDESETNDRNNNNNIVNINKNKNNSRKINSRRSNRKNNNDNNNDKESIKINQKPKLYNRNIEEFTITDYDPSDENYSIYDIDDDDGANEKGFIENLKKNQRLIKRSYEIAINNKNANFVEILLTEILDKIYLIKILLFTKKFDILSLQLSVYVLCHILLLVLNALFFDIKTIKKIWNEDNYPGLGYYLGYGFLSCIIIWIIYKIFLCLLNNNDKIKEILKMIHLNKKYNLNKEKLIYKKYNNFTLKLKIKFTIYTIIEFLLLSFCFIYLSVFCTVYIGTMSKVFKEYGVALIEILIIKIIYGIALAIMRRVSLSKSNKKLYDVVLFMNTYLV